MSPTPGSAERDAVVAALDDASRRRMLEVLAGSAGMNAGEIAGQVNLTRQGVLKHLQVLTGAGLVASRRSGREVLFTVRPGPLRDTATWLNQLADHWDHQLQALKRAAGEGCA